MTRRTFKCRPLEIDYFSGKRIYVDFQQITERDHIDSISRYIVVSSLPHTLEYLLHMKGGTYCAEKIAAYLKCRRHGRYIGQSIRFGLHVLRWIQMSGNQIHFPLWYSRQNLISWNFYSKSHMLADGLGAIILYIVYFFLSALYFFLFFDELRKSYSFFLFYCFVCKFNQHSVSVDDITYLSHGIFSILAFPHHRLYWYLLRMRKWENCFHWNITLNFMLLAQRNLSILFFFIWNNFAQFTIHFHHFPAKWKLSIVYSYLVHAKRP